MATWLFLLYVVFSLVALARAMPFVLWALVTGVYLVFGTIYAGMGWLPFTLLLAAVAFITVLLKLESLRLFISDKLYHRASLSIPKLSKTEEEALNAGDTWLEAGIFTGNPNLKQLANITTELTEEEQAFLDNETETLCGMLDEWEISQSKDLPEPVWNYMKEKGFFGLVITKEHGGKGFSGRAHSDVVLKIATRSGVAAVTVMVPNSLGPGELLHYYGTDEQKKHYLPRLAKGLDIPCFALTEPGAGSDATSIQSEAIVVKQKVGTKTVLGLNLTLDKRWITLAPVATLIGLAVKLKDPDGLLGGEGEEGITCVLIPRDTENLEIGARHLPAEQPFMNGTIRGRDIFVPITNIIGGQKMAGQGWHMLVECLSIGRSISLPALATASSSVSYLTSGAFSRIRRQFNVEIKQFEGIDEKLAEIAGLNYLINATRLLTATAVAHHKKPSVASAITKCFNTELARKVVNATMDIHGGRAVVTGPRNYLSNCYQGIPISVTVEGANIMTRNLLIFGQGSMACHPYIREELYAVGREDKRAFHDLIWKHIAYFMQNFAKALTSAWTGGFFIAPTNNILPYEQKKLIRLSYSYAFIADLSLIFLGGALKRKERLSARLADALSYLYMGLAVLAQCQGENKDKDTQLHAKWALTYCFHHAQSAMLGVCANFPSRFIGFFMRIVAFPLGLTMRYPKDSLDHALANSMTTNNPYRKALTKMIYLSGDSKDAIDRVENAFQLLVEHGALYEKVTDLKRVGFAEYKNALKEKVTQGALNQSEADILLSIEKARWDAILVDEFTFDSMKEKQFQSITGTLKTPFD